MEAYNVTTITIKETVTNGNVSLEISSHSQETKCVPEYKYRDKRIDQALAEIGVAAIIEAADKTDGEVTEIKHQ